MNNESFRDWGHKMIDWIADYFDKVENYPVKSRVEPGDIKKSLSDYPPEQGEEMEKIWQDFQDIILPGVTHWQHPGWFAYFPANNSPASVLGELLSAGLGVQGMVWETSPAAEELEEVVLDWLRQMLGLPQGLHGVIQDTASTATLVSLLTAREVATDFKSNEEGINEKLKVYASQETHSSIEKGMKIAGYGRKNLHQIPTDDNYALKPEALEKALKDDLKEGKQPACVVATIGTTSSTAIDPLPEIGEICRRYGVWLHVDAAFAGTAAILEEKQDLLEGAEYLDSFVFNPHKWMFTNFDCSAYFVKEPELLIKTLAINPEYLKTARDDQVNNYRDWGIQLGRRFRALKLWFVIRDYGVEGLQKLIKKHIELAEDFADWIQRQKDFELLAPLTTSLVCFRWNNNSHSEEELNKINREILEKINESEKIYLTHTSLRGKYTLRLVVGQRTTSAEEVKLAQNIIEQAKNEVLDSVQGD